MMLSSGQHCRIMVTKTTCSSIHSSRLPKRLFIFLFLVVFLPPHQSTAGEGGEKSTVPFDVGVILDSKTWLGNISWEFMSMAVDDFYRANPGHKTRLTMHLRDTDRNDVVAAAAAALGLIVNVKVEAIIGPQTSTQAKFILKIGNKTQVPVISFSAKSSTLPANQSPYFIQTSWNDSSQATVLACLVEKFGWTEVVPVVEDTDYGYAFVPYLLDALEAIDVRVPYRSIIPVSATKDQIVAELKKLNGSRTRVFLVHMLSSLGLTFFSVAKEVGMMGNGYAWITSYGLTEVVTNMGSSAIDAMQGILGVMPHEKGSKRLRDLKARWQKLYYKSHSNAVVTEPTIFGLWAYDTVWSLAMAAEKLNKTTSNLEILHNNSLSDLATFRPSPRGSTLLYLLSSTKFNGVSGEFQLANGQLQATLFEIINVVKQGARNLGYWTPRLGISGDINLKSNLKPIMWPGGSSIRPKGWEWPTKGNKLRIGIPVEPGFPQFVNMAIDPGTKRPKYTGYCIEVFDYVMKLLPYHVPYEYHPFVDSNGEMNGTYNDLVYQVYLQNYDAVVGDLTILANRSLYVDFTLPYTESGVSMVVPIKDKSDKNAWTFLKPLSGDLWLISSVFFVFTGLVVWVIEHRINEEFQGQLLDQAGVMFYFSFSTLVFAHTEKILSNLAKIVIIVWVFVVLILQQSYMASLTSMLTVEQLQPTVADINELVKNENYIGYLNGSFMPGLLQQLNFKESKLIAYNTIEEYNEALTNGSVAAIFDELPYLRVFLSKYCKKYTMIGPTFKTGGFGFVFPKGSPLVRDISKMILILTESEKMVEIEKRLYGDQTCPDDSSSQTTSSRLSLYSFWGLFLVCGSTSLVALLVHILHFIYGHKHTLRDGSDGSLRKRLSKLVKLYAQAEVSSDAPKEELSSADETVVISGMIGSTLSPCPPSVSEEHTPGNVTPANDNNDEEDNDEETTEVMPKDDPCREISN